MESSAKTESTKIHRHGFVAEIVCKSGSSPQIFHYVIQREFSTGIVYWGQEVSHQRALECIEDFLRSYDAAQKNA